MKKSKGYMAGGKIKLKVMLAVESFLWLKKMESKFLSLLLMAKARWLVAEWFLRPKAILKAAKLLPQKDMAPLLLAKGKEMKANPKGNGWRRRCQR